MGRREDDGHVPWRTRLRHGAIGVAAFFVLAAAGGAAFVWSGVYDIGALRQHSAPVLALLTTTMDRSIDEYAESVDVPARFGDPAVAAAGFDSYQESCQQCHGAPGVAPDPAGLGMTPVPTNLAQSARMRDPAEIYWVTRNGLKMTGMPAWEFSYDDEELWQLTAFVESLEFMSPVQYAELARTEDEGALDAAAWREVVEDRQR